MVGKTKIIAMKANPVDQSSCNSFSELVDGYQVYKTVPEARNDQQTAKKAWSDYIVNCYINKMVLACDRKPLPIIDINRTDLNYITRK